MKESWGEIPFSTNCWVKFSTNGKTLKTEQITGHLHEDEDNEGTNKHKTNKHMWKTKEAFTKRQKSRTWLIFWINTDCNLSIKRWN